MHGAIMGKAGTGKPWQLVADIGGTNARFARKQYGSNALQDITTISVAGHAQFSSALSVYLAGNRTGQWSDTPEAACFAVACRVDHEEIRFTNSPWTFTRTELSTLLGGTTPELINDFAAKGYGIAELSGADWVQVGGTEPVSNKPAVILGPGTGLGVSMVVPTQSGFVVVDGEGGHVDFAPVNAEEFRVLEILASRFGRVSVERLLCGAGLVNINHALGTIRQEDVRLTTPEAIVAAGTSGNDSLAVATLALFCRVLGSVAGNLALTAGALGGVYITGGIVPAMLAFFQDSGFRARFEDKGRFRDYLARIPVRVVTRQDLGLLGAANRLTLAGH